MCLLEGPRAFPKRVMTPMNHMPLLSEFSLDKVEEAKPSEVPGKKLILLHTHYRVHKSELTIRITIYLANLSIYNLTAFSSMKHFVLFQKHFLYFLLLGGRQKMF